MKITREQVKKAKKELDKHTLSAKDVKKLQKRIRSLKKSRMRGTDAIAQEIQRYIDQHYTPNQDNK